MTESIRCFCDNTIFVKIYKVKFYCFRFDVTEAQFAVIGAYLFTALMGSSFWETPVLFSHNSFVHYMYRSPIFVANSILDI